MNSRFTLGLISPHPKDGTSFYRGHGPFNYLAKECPWLDLYHGTPSAADAATWSWPEMEKCHAIFLQRPANEKHVQLAQLAKQAQLPLWIDFDDDVTCVPGYNPFRRSFPMPKTQQMLAMLCDMADVISCTSEAIAEKAGEKAVIIPNALNDYLTGWNNKPRQKVITWRGSATHNEDLESVLPQMQEAYLDTAWKWGFLGDPGYRVEEAMTGVAGRTQVGPAWTDWVSLVNNLGNSGSFIHIVPLLPNMFNRSKSNCAWLEATAAGAAVLAPTLPEWIRPGITNYTDPKDFGKKLALLMGEWANGSRHPNVELSRKFIAENLLLSKVNAQREAVIYRIVADGKWWKSKIADRKADDGSQPLPANSE